MTDDGLAVVSYWETGQPSLLTFFLC